MKKSIVSWETARNLLLEKAKPVQTERVDLIDAVGRVMAEDLIAIENVPAFDRSPYDGYAIRSADLAAASDTSPVTLRILEEVPAGAVPTIALTPGTATKVLTGAPIPEGADAVIMYERTVFTVETVTIATPVAAGENIERAGEDIVEGQLLAEAGQAIDAGIMGVMAAQGVMHPRVYRKPRIALISTGNEVVEPGEALLPGKIHNVSRYTLTTALRTIGCEVKYVGIVGDDVRQIAAAMSESLADCDAVLTTGGVSVGDYDLTPAAMEAIGADIFVGGVRIKPGMACAFGVKSGKLLLGLSGNPASAMTNLYADVLPALRKLCGYRKTIPQEISITLADAFPKKSKVPRFLRGHVELSEGKPVMHLSSNQGNVVVSSMIGQNAVAIIPAGSGPIAAGTELKGYML